MSTDGKLSLEFFVPIRLWRGENNREHPMARARRVNSERQAVFWASMGLRRAVLAALVPTPCTVRLTRISPGPGLDEHDNLRGACKGAVDELASIMGINDRDPRVTWKYAQRSGPWGLLVQVTAMLPGPVVVEKRGLPKALAGWSPERIRRAREGGGALSSELEASLDQPAPKVKRASKARTSAFGKLQPTSAFIPPRRTA